MLKYTGDFDKLKDYGFIKVRDLYIKWLSGEFYSIRIDDEDEYGEAENIDELIAMNLPKEQFENTLLTADIVGIRIKKDRIINVRDQKVYYPTGNQNYAHNTLYDLIKDGLVEKIEE